MKMSTKHKRLHKWLLAATILVLLQLLLAHKVQAETRFVISIIDTGIDLKNETLKKQLCRNEGEMGRDKNGNPKSTNGMDDDGNGYIDDLHGWSFFDKSNDLQDQHGHGTHVAGIIYQELKQLKLENEFCFQVLKYYNSETYSPHLLQASNQSLKYAALNKSQLINYSGGGYAANKEEEFWLRQLAHKNIPVMAAMGNQTLDTDQFPFYPAGYDLENVFAIAAATPEQTRAPFSNYGKRKFDFMAPGVHIKAFGLNNSQAYLSGTSQATAKASAMVAYLVYQNQNTFDWKDLKTNLKNWRQIYSRLNKKENPEFLDSGFIQKYKTTQVDAFGEPSPN
ncbi:MAG: S8 family serine peptidase [Bdellovibrionaceae bacterium]|nr:S8 family serine peptidase [Pseudobdellovibrionaceae bacterium]